MTDLRAVWLPTRIFITSDGRTFDLDDVPAGGLSKAVAPLVPPICIVTAWNPMGEVQPSHANEAANRRLQAELDVRGRPWLPAEGKSPDGTWSEASFAIDSLSEADARALGRRWVQLAVFYITEEEVAVLDSDDTFRDARPRGH